MTAHLRLQPELSKALVDVFREIRPLTRVAEAPWRIEGPGDPEETVRWAAFLLANEIRQAANNALLHGIRVESEP